MTFAADILSRKTSRTNASATGRARLLGTTSLTAAMMAGVLGLASPAMAQQTWDPNAAAGLQGGSGTWDPATTTSWTDDGGATNVIYNAASPPHTFAGATGGTVTVDGGGITLSTAVNFAATGNNTHYTIIGGVTTVAAGGTTINVATVTGVTDAGWQANIANAGNLLTIAGAGNSLLTGSISGAGGLTKNGAGLLQLGAANGYAGVTTVNAGTLSAAAGAIGSTGNAIDVQIAGGTLQTNAGAIVDTADVDISSGSWEMFGAETIGSLSGAGGTIVTDSNAVGNVLTVSGNGETTAFAGVISGAGGLTKSGTDVLTLSGANTYSGGTVISGGTIRITDANDLGTGDVTLGGGTLAANNTLTLTNPNFFWGASTTGTIAAATGQVLTLDPVSYIRGANSVVRFGTAADTGTVVLGNGGMSTGLGAQVFIDFGTVQVGNATVATNFFGQVASNTIAAGATLDIAGFTVVVQDLSGAGNITNSGPADTLTLDNAATTTFSGVISGTGVNALALTKTGAGTLTLSGNNNDLGGTLTVNVGTLSLTGTGNTLSIIDVNAGTLSLTGSNSITGDATVDAGATLVLGGTNDFNGNDINVAGTLSIQTSTATNNVNQIVTNGSVIDYANGVNEATPVQIASPTTQFQVLTGSATQSGIVSQDVAGRPFEKIGAGTLILSAANTYTGVTTVTAGTLNITGSIASNGNAVDLLLNGGNAIVDGASLLDTADVGIATGDFSLTGNETIGSLSGAGGTVTLAANTLTVDGDGETTTFAGVIGGTGGLTKSGTDILTLSGANTYSGATTISGGTLAVSSSANLGNASATNDLVFNGGTLRADAALATGTRDVIMTGAGTINTNGNAVTVAGVITGAGALTKSGAGTLTLTGNSSAYAGNTTVNAGTLLVNNTAGTFGTAATTVTVNTGATLGGTGTIGGDVNVVGGTTAAGTSPGTLNILGDLTYNAASNANFELGGPGVVNGNNPTTGNDLITVGGNLVLDGTLNLSNPAGGSVLTGYYTLYQVAGTTTNNLDAVTTAAGPTVTTADIYVTNGGLVGNEVNLLIAGVGQNVQFWDGNFPSANGAVNGGAGTWNGTNTNWTTATGAINDSWRTDVGIFSVAGGAVAVAGTQNFEGLQFTANGYTLAGGTLNMTGDSAGNVNASFINVDPGVSVTIGSAITGNAPNIGLDKFGTGTLILSGTNTYTGATTVNAGTLIVAGGAAIDDTGAVVVNGGTFELGSSETIGSLSGVAGTFVDVNGNTLIVAQGAGNTFGGNITGSGTFDLQGSTTLTLSGASDITGIVGVGVGTDSTGTLEIAAGGSVAATTVGASASGTLILNGGALTATGAGLFAVGTIEVNGSETAGAASVSLGGEIQINGAATVLTLNGTASPLIPGGNTTVSGDVTGTGTLNITGGTTTVSATGDVQTATTIGAGGTVVNNGTMAAVGNAGSLTNNLTITGAVNNAATFNNNAAGTVSGLLTNTAGTTTNAGQLNGGATVTGGTVTNNNLIAGTVNISGAGIVNNNLTITGAVNNAATFNNNAAGTVSGLLTNTAGTTTNTGTINGGANITGGTLTTTGTVTGGLTNAATVNAAGIINGPIANNAGTFNVTGNLASNSTFTNAATLNVDGGTYTVAGLITNSGTLVVDAGATLTAPALTNTATGTVTNNGTLNDALNNAGLVNNNAIYNADVATNTGTINNNAPGVWTGNVLTNTTGTINNFAGATWVGNANNNGGTLNNAGTWTGTITNTSIFNNTGTVSAGLTNTGIANAQGTILGAIQNQAGGLFNLTGNLAGNGLFTNAGTFVSAGTRSITGITGFTNAGTISLQQGATGDSLSLAGTYTGSGASTINVDMNLTTAVGASDSVVLDTTSGATVVNFTGPTGALQAAPTLVVSTTDGNLVATEGAGLLDVGLVQYDLVEMGDDWFILSQLNLAPIGGIVGGISSAQALINSAVNRPASAFVTSPIDVEADTCAPGGYGRVFGGTSTAESTTTSAVSAPTDSEVDLNYGGAQFGADFGCFNIGGDGAAINVGVLGGVNVGKAKQNQPTTPAGSTLLSEANFDSRYGGIYATYVKGSFFGDVQLSYDLTSFTINSQSTTGGVITPYVINQKPDSERVTVSSSVGYAFGFDDISVVPSAGFAYSRTRTDTIGLVQNNGQLVFDDLDSFIGFASVAVAKTIILPNETSAIQPFLTGTLYHDFGDDQQVTFIDSSNPGGVATSTENLGTFGELSAGMNYRSILDPTEDVLREFSASVRGDLNFSDRLLGGRITGQVRLQF